MTASLMAAENGSVPRRRPLPARSPSGLPRLLPLLALVLLRSCVTISRCRREGRPYAVTHRESCERGAGPARGINVNFARVLTPKARLVGCAALLDVLVVLARRSVA